MKKRNDALRVWLVLDSQSFGGIESHIVQLSLGLISLGCKAEVVFVKQYNSAHPMLPKLKALCIPYRFLSGSPIDLYKQVKFDQPDAIHTHGYKASLYARLVRPFISPPIISTMHAGEIGSGKLKFYLWLERNTHQLSHHCFAVSSKIADRVKTPIPIIKNFINIEQSKFSNGEQIAFVGRLSEEKAPDRFLEMASNDLNHQYHVYGDGPMMQTLNATATENVIFHGQQTDMSGVWQNIGLLVIPSHYEGLPMVALEAMSRSIPVVSTPVGDLPKLIQNGVNGWVNEYSLLPAAIAQWQSMPQVKKMALKKMARRAIENSYSAQAVIPSLLQVYQRCIRD
ncbi:glycosyltransferase family 4 protein [Vibrio penaeicida]|uniref:glycosyltransferase family 4 protein n=1 Tax=Vibrio penaeicida TaxID=104609 RepID=UPI000CEA57C9|nr:glycosyltransferase family 4 protein [Vibrio penaeicida]